MNFSDADQHPYDQIEWCKTEAKITDDGDAARGADPRTGGRESSVQQLINRVVDTITAWGVKDGYFASGGGDAESFADDLTWLLVNQYGAFNSPVWFNLGLFQAYGIGKDAGPGNWVWDPVTKEAHRASSQYEWPQISACFILSVKDNMESILDLAKAEAMLFKYGSGAGTDLSTLRSTREKLSGGGTPSGPLSFLRIYDAVAATVKSMEVVC